MSYVTPTDAYSQARNGENGFVGWAYYRQQSLGFHADADEQTVTVWSPSGDGDHDIDASVSPNGFLDALDAYLDGQEDRR